MPGLLSTPLGRALRMVLGLFVLAVGTSQVSVLGLCLMLTGLLVTVTAVATPSTLTPTPAVTRSARRPVQTLARLLGFRLTRV
jgi:hypothetical protein